MLAILWAMYYNVLVISRCDGMVDVTDSKSVGGNIVWVRVPPPAPNFPSNFDRVRRELFISKTAQKYTYFIKSRTFTGNDRFEMRISLKLPLFSRVTKRLLRVTNKGLRVTNRQACNE